MPIFVEKAATGVGTSIDVSNYRYVALQVSAALNSSLTFKIQGSLSDTAPTFSSAQSGSNHWDYIHVYDMNTPSSGIPGDTGVTLNNDTVANNTRQYIVNVDLIKWLNVEITSYTDGDLTVKALLATDI